MFTKPAFILDYPDNGSTASKCKLSGKVDSGNTAVKTIWVYFRPTGELLSSTNAHHDGTWEIFLATPVDDEQLVVLCRDEGGEYNADIYDRLSLCTVVNSNDIPYVYTLVRESDYVYSTAVPISKFVIGFSNTVSAQSHNTEIAKYSLKDSVYKPIYYDASDLVVEPPPSGLLLDGGVTFKDGYLGVINYNGELLFDIFDDNSSDVMMDFTSGQPVDPVSGAEFTSLDFTVKSDGIKYYGNTSQSAGSVATLDGYAIDGECCICFLLNRESERNTNYYLDVLNQENTLFFSWRRSVGYFQIKTGTGTAWNALTTITISPAKVLNTWYHIAINCKATELEFYVDGELLQTVSTPAPVNSGTPLILGTTSTSYLYWGITNYNNFRIFNKALLESQIVTLANEIQSAVVPANFTCIEYSGAQLGFRNVVKPTALLQATSCFASKVGDYAITKNGVEPQHDSVLFTGISGVMSAPTCSDASGLYSVGDESAIDITAHIELLDSTSAQIIYKSGGGTDGIALGIDASGNFGIFGRAAGVLTSITVPASNVAGVGLYIEATKSYLHVYDSAMQLLATATGTVAVGNGTEQETVGMSCGSSPISGSTAVEPFTGRIYDIDVHTEGTTPLLGASGDIGSYKFGTDRDGLAEFNINNSGYAPGPYTIPGNAMLFTGTVDTAISMPDTIRELFRADKWSLSVWFKNTRDTSTRYTIIGSSTNVEIALSTGNSTLYVYANSKSCNATVPFNEWVHVAVVVDRVSNFMRLYINGELMDSEVFTSDPTYYDYELRVGSNYSTNYFTGGIGDIIIMDTALNDQEVKNIYYNSEIAQPPLGTMSTCIVRQENVGTPALFSTDLESIGITELPNSYSDIYIALSFNSLTYKIYTLGAWVNIVSSEESIHGNTGSTNWHYFASSSLWVETTGSLEEALSLAISDNAANRMDSQALSSIAASAYTEVFDLSTGHLDVSMSMQSDIEYDVPLIDLLRINSAIIWTSELLYIDDYPGTTAILADWEYMYKLGDTPVPFKVFSIVSGQTTWNEITNNGGAVTGVEIGAGKSLQFKVEFYSNDPAPDAIGLNAIFKK